MKGQGYNYGDDDSDEVGEMPRYRQFNSEADARTFADGVKVGSPNAKVIIAKSVCDEVSWIVVITK